MKNKWILVSENPPIDEGEVYAYNKDTEIVYPDDLYYDEDDGKWYDKNCVENAEYDLPPTHWCKKGSMPDLPK